MKKKITVLGGGRIGAAIADNLAQDHAVRLADLSVEHLKGLSQRCELRACDLGDAAALKDCIDDAEVVVGALPSRMGYTTLERLIRAGKQIVDISFFAEDALALDDLAKQHGVSALVDFGLAPGLSNLYAGHLLTRFDRLEEFVCMVGGVPTERVEPFQYKAPFAPLDVIEEYTRPARMRRHGEDLVLPAMSEIEALYFDGIGSMEAFNTDGLRSLLKTTDIPNMAEKTVRYPGHARFIQQLIDAGFFSPEHRENTAKVLLQQWQFQPGETDLTVMQMRAAGHINGVKKTFNYQLIDHFDAQRQVSSMARTTGYTCAAGVRLLLNHSLPHGVLPPELIGRKQDWFDALMQELAVHNIVIREV